MSKQELINLLKIANKQADIVLKLWNEHILKIEQIRNKNAGTKST